jgi:aryl-alcohol dehydrogenase-like predicted oxidoreductase
MGKVKRTALRPGYEISRVIRGGWQLAGGHGVVDRVAAVDDLAAFYDAGIVTFDCADIYTGVEELIGEFRKQVADRRGREALAGLRVHTKLVPDLELLPRLRKSDVRGIIDRSLLRLRSERLDLVQFHWWDYAIHGMVEAALWLDELRHEGKVEPGGANSIHKHAGAAERRRATGVDAGAVFLLMRSRSMVCRSLPPVGHPFSVTVGGRRFRATAVWGAEPQPPFENALTKYKLIIDDFGGWSLFQELLRALRRIADRHGSDIATVASRAMLDRPQVAAVIVGARNRSHLPANVAITALQLTAEDHQEIAAVLARRKGPAGDSFALERDRTGRHGAIMKYNLNKATA